MATLGLSKVFILDKYFTELQKFWETEKKLQDASSSNEAVHLQQRLKSLSTELVTLRNRLHVGQHAAVSNGNVAINNNATVSATTTAVSTTAPTTTTTTNKQQPFETGTGNGTLACSSNVTTNNVTTATPAPATTTTTTVLTSNTLTTTSVAGIKNHANHNMMTTSHAMSLITNNTTQSMQISQQQQQQQSFNAIFQNNNTSNHGHNQTSFTIGNNKNNTNNNNHHHNKLSHNFSQTLPHNSSTSGLISSRNTSIPHPLPHQIIEKTNGKDNFAETTDLQGFKSLPYNSHTLPLRSALSHNEIGRRSLKLVNPCHGIPTLSFGMAYENLPIRANIKRHSFKSLQLSKCEDLINLSGPLTEDAILRTLHARFKENCYFTNIGPILLSINSYADIGNPLTLSSTRTLPLAPQLSKIVQEAVRQQAETGYPQAIILSGTSGAGKTHCSMLLLRQLFAVAGGGPETDAFKHLAAAFTVLRSLGSAKTTTNSECSRIGQFIEVQVTDGALYRTKIHCYFLDQTRVVRPLPREKNYHIFYQMLVGLSREERIKLNLEGYSPANLRYLQTGDLTQNEQHDAARFQEWKTCLGILGIPYLDVVRVLAAVLLLGNVQFMDGQGLEVDVNGAAELNSVASLLGVPPAALFRGLTTRTHNARGQLVKSVCDANMSNMTRDCLAKALYCRTVATIVRRANSLKRLGSTLGTLSSDSNESVHNQLDVASQHASTVGGNSGSKSMAALNNAVRHATDGFIGILDMFGFEEPNPHAQLEHLCINLCSETMQHFYNTHIFKSSVESCRDEGIICDNEVDYVDNVPCIDLISSLRTGLLSMLDAECAARGTAESYVAKIKVQHRTSPRLEAKSTAESHDPRMFVIRHFAGRVEYDSTDFLDTNRDVVPDDLVAVFYKHSCNFGFATHLFGSELKALYALQNVPRGLSFRISPTSHTDLLNGDEPVSTLTQDFHTRLDNLLRTLVHARPHFVRCIRSNASETPHHFDRPTVIKQIRALQVLETVNLMASGFPHRMRFKQFNARYRMLAPFQLLRRNEERALDDCKLILQYAMENPPHVEGSVTLAWAPGKRHVFLSEGIRQHLEHLRAEIRRMSASRIQAVWRGWQWRKKMDTRKCKLSNNINNNNNTSANKMLKSQTAQNVAKSTGAILRPRPQPIAGTPPPDPQEKCDAKLIQQTCALFGLDLERPPPVPSSRSYTIMGKSKLGFPQSRVMKMNFSEDAMPSGTAFNEQLKKGETVCVVGPSNCRGHLIVEHKGQTFHVPFQYMELLIATTADVVSSGTTIAVNKSNPNANTNANANINAANNVNSNSNNNTILRGGAVNI